jgi:hypothetical protein
LQAHSRRIHPGGARALAFLADDQSITECRPNEPVKPTQMSQLNVYVLPEDGGPLRFVSARDCEYSKGKEPYELRYISWPFVCPVMPGETLAALRKDRLSRQELVTFSLIYAGEKKKLEFSDVPFDVIPDGGTLCVVRQRARSTSSLFLRRD